MANLVAVRDGGLTGDDYDGLYSPAKEKAASRGICNGRFRSSTAASGCCLAASRPSSSSSNKLDVKVTKILAPLRVAQIRGGYTVLINTWKRDSLLKQSVGHHASCSGTDAIHVVWSESDPPSDKLKAYLKKIVLKKSQTAQKPNFRFDLNKEDNLNNRFKPIEDLRTDAIFSVDDDIIVPCPALDFAFTVWQSAPSTMVGFVPRMHWLNKERNSVLQYRYGGWWSVWWMGTYSMVLSKAAFLHRKYLDLYTYKMSSSVHDYVTKERLEYVLPSNEHISKHEFSHIIVVMTEPD
ncbi:hypothetical protein RJ640_022916 [Escallonia rubra]|uniref:Glycosyl transferase 64 domain-containing protein n=1 Tax=Escallonia rubra TaxID=112253 RepID=A0AA88R478_9ASTE|nr:hypothetical protein RJ640_022916 [Escallonia rubra]